MPEEEKGETLALVEVIIKKKPWGKGKQVLGQSQAGLLSHDKGAIHALSTRR